MGDYKKAYQLWQAPLANGNHRTWEGVAKLSGYPSGAAATMAVRRYALRADKPLRNARQQNSVDDVERRRMSYCAYLMGWSWEDIADEYQWASRQVALTCVKKYANRNDLPLRRLP